MTPTGVVTRLGILTFADTDSPDLGAAGLGAILAGLDPMVSWRRRSTTLIDVVGTAALTPILSQVIPAGLLGPSGLIRASMRGDWLNNVGSNQGCRVVISLGGVTLFDWTNGSLGSNSGSRSPTRFDVEIANLGAQNANYMSGRLGWSDTSLGPATTGIGPFTTGTGQYVSQVGSAGAAAIDTSLAQTLLVSLAPTVSNGLLSFRRYWGEVEVS